MSQIKVRDENGKPCELINIRIADKGNNSESAYFDVFTDFSGNTGWPIPFWPPRARTLFINDRSINEDYQRSLEVDAPHDNDYYIVLPFASGGIQAGEKGFLHVEGREFVDENGVKWPFIGYTIHTLLNSIFDGGAKRVNEMLDEPIELGYNNILGHGMHASPFKNANGLRLDPTEHPDFYDKLAEFFDICAARGIRVAYGIFADLQFLPHLNARAHFNKSCDVMRGRWNVFARKGNEPGVNGWNPDDYSFPNMGGVLTSQGQQGVATDPHPPYLDFVEYAPRRDEHKWLYDSGSGMMQMADGDFPGPKLGNRPLINAEPSYFAETNPDEVGDHRRTDPSEALRLGVLSTANCSGLAAGFSFGLVGKKLRPRERICASECARGAISGFVR